MLDQQHYKGVQYNEKCILLKEMFLWYAQNLTTIEIFYTLRVPNFFGYSQELSWYVLTSTVNSLVGQHPTRYLLSFQEYFLIYSVIDLEVHRALDFVR